MRAVFVETIEFTEWISEFLPDETYAELQRQLMDDPQRGNVIPGGGGLRKIRVSDPRRRRGKRGGARVIYLYVPEASWFFMLDVYGKGEQDDLTAVQKRSLQKLAEELKRQARQAAKRWKGHKD
ncbi:MAG TPA: type II toxin-antitoxin system RelE/ParE family toxin [Planctomycetaceae bacterium]|nr:type II toxin-antitoxin system RelE/ParE family toxin [Planctomycetaceae bacterium]